MKVNKTNIYEIVEFLTTITPTRNYKNIESLNKVAKYIADKFKKMGYQTEEQKWIAKGNEYKNIIAIYKSNNSNNKKLIVGGHYDVYGDFPGADDNATAIAGLLETARLVIETSPKLDYDIEFVAYSLEEPPFSFTKEMGSYVHASSVFEKTLLNNDIDIIGMVCYEMIGFFSDEEDTQTYPIAEMELILPTIGNFISVVGIEKFSNFTNSFFTNMKKNSDIKVEQLLFPTEDGIAELSDHSSYWKFDFPAVMITDTAFFRNPYYHTKDDTIDTLNFDKMSEVIESSFRAIIKM